MSSRIRNCHYVPQTYQKSWAIEDGKVFYYNSEDKEVIVKGGNTRGLYKPEKQMFMQDYYDTTLESINFLENYFSSKFENDWQVNVLNIKKILNDNMNKVDELNLSDFNTISINAILEFMSIQYYRIYDNCIEFIDKAILDQGHDPSSVSEDIKIEAWKGGLIDISSSGLYAPQLLDRFKNLNIAFYVSENKSFIMSDNPVAKIACEDSKSISYVFALTPKICIEVNNSQSNGIVKLFKIEDNDVLRLNNTLLNNSLYVFGYHEFITDIKEVFPPNV